jgi:hypothetical protein
LILVTLPSLILLVGERTISEAGQREDTKDFAQNDRSLRIAEDVLTELVGKETLKNREAAQQAIATGLTILPKLLTRDRRHAQELGFQVGKDTKDTIEDIIKKGINPLDYAFPIFEIHLNDLRSFTPGKDVKQLLFYKNQLLLPIGVDNDVHKQFQSSLTIQLTLDEPGENEQKRVGITWRPIRWGQPNLIRLLTNAQDQLTTQKRGFLVSIPSLNRNFLGYKEGTAIKFVPLVTDRLFNKEESLSAEDAFGRLSAEAINVDDTPR